MPRFGLRWSSSQQHSHAVSVSFSRQCCRWQCGQSWRSFIKVGFTARTQGACSQPRCGESPRAKLQRVSSEDCRTPVRGQAVKQSAEMVGLACSQRCCGESPRAKLQRVSSEDCKTPVRGQAVKQSAEMVGLACSQRRCGESPRVKLQRVSSEDRRTPVCGQAVKQSAVMRSALEFFATAQSCRERSLESVN